MNPKCLTTKIGNHYETKTAEYLQQSGVVLLERNFRLRLGELDLIGIDQTDLVFFEVRYRKGPMGSGLEAMSAEKLCRVQRTATLWLQKKETWVRKNYPATRHIRIDLLFWSEEGVRWIKNVG